MYSNDHIARLLDKLEESAPIEVKTEIQIKQTAAKALDPTLQEGCEDLNTIATVELAKSKSIDIEALIGKPSPETEDEDTIIINELSK